MIKIEKTDVFGWESAIRGMRNPMNSWDKSDTDLGKYYIDFSGNVVLPIGKNDLSLMKKLVNAGADHSKFMRMINVTCDITAPLYWWKEYDTYKVGTVANSCSTMHKIHDKNFTLEDFSHDYLTPESLDELKRIISLLNHWRDVYNNGSSILAPKSKTAWQQLIQLLPSSYNQKRTVQLNYAVLRNMYHSRKNHKLDEWHVLCEWIEGLPYASDLIVGKERSI